MCYILCLTVPRGLGAIDDHFDDSVQLRPLADESLATSAMGALAHRAYAVTVGGCSCDLLVGGHRMANRPELVTAAVEHLLADASEIALLKHWFTRPVHEVEVRCARERQLKFGRFRTLYPRLEDDVRYVIARG